MKSTKEIALERAIAMLKAANATFAVITESGEEIIHGDIQIVKKADLKRKKKDRPLGALVNHYGPIVKNMSPGDVVTVPANDFVPQELRSAISAWACEHWGAKSAITSVRPEGVEVLRIV